MIVCQPAGNEIVAEISAKLLFTRQRCEIFAHRPRETGRLDVNHHALRVDLLECLHCSDNAASELEHYPDVAGVALQIRRPETAHPAHQRIYYRFVERRVP